MVIAIFFGILISYLVIGFIASRHTKGADEFYVTGRRSGIILVLGGFAGTWISALGTLGYPGMSYSQGIGLVAIWGALPDSCWRLSLLCLNCIGAVPGRFLISLNLVGRTRG